MNFVKLVEKGQRVIKRNLSLEYVMSKKNIDQNKFDSNRLQIEDDY